MTVCKEAMLPAVILFVFIKMLFYSYQLGATCKDSESSARLDFQKHMCYDF